MNLTFLTFHKLMVLGTLLSSTQKFSPYSLYIHNSKFGKFSSHVLYSSEIFLQVQQSSFRNFLDSPFHLQSTVFQHTKYSPDEKVHTTENMHFTDCIFLNCRVQQNDNNEGNGGAICVDTSYSNYEFLYVQRCGFRNCSASSDGGAIYILGCDFRIDSSQFEKCDAYSKGSSIYILFYSRSKKVSALCESISIRKGSKKGNSNLYSSIQNIQIQYYNISNSRSKEMRNCVASISHSTYCNLKFLSMNNIQAHSFFSFCECSNKFLTRYFILQHTCSLSYAFEIDQMDVPLKFYRFSFENIKGPLIKLTRSEKLIFLNCYIDNSTMLTNNKHVFEGIDDISGLSQINKNNINMTFNRGDIDKAWDLGNPPEFTMTFKPTNIFQPSSSFSPSAYFSFDQDYQFYHELIERRKKITGVPLLVFLATINEYNTT
ncbi:hypothetical protein TRFO_35934 [Tritrichomonas foetus]|uniref:Uncharacterized protein n=1 Tax=Tritrichomonas foetus TaxID=1144522 RepID=A0A1J4JF42_9EUKA|nr:hypothetical protein TRFO_35934 [Tritrichomonas foetus]|eukprot:OHS97762.1 hypothetical protein TRFO_35934 [Tritrichomonas foetus]